MKASVKGIVLGGFLGVVIAGCSSSGSSSSGPPDTAHFAGAMASSFCGALHSCCDAQKITYDDGSCTAQLQALFQQAIDVVKHGKVVYDPSAVAACQDAMKKRESACSEDAGPLPGPDTKYVDPISAACWPVLKGTVEPGGECTTASECKTSGPEVSASCQTDNRAGADPSKKVCFTVSTHVQPGGECRQSPASGSFDSAYCEPTRGYCDTSGASPMDPSAGKCVAYANVGDDCVGTNPQQTPRCNPTAGYCDYASSRKCVALPGPGQPCAVNGFPACAAGAYCDRSGGTATGTCTASKAAGDSCQTSQECASQYCQTTFGDGGPVGVCSAPNGASHDLYDISPRTCGFGPEGVGPDDAGIVPPAKGKRVSGGESSSASATSSDGRWYLGQR